jgi:hypothetical protein
LAPKLNESGQNRLLSALPVNERERLIERCRRDSSESRANVYSMSAFVELKRVPQRQRNGQLEALVAELSRAIRESEPAQGSSN